MRRVLTVIYTVSGVLSAACMVVIAGIIIAQVAGRSAGMIVRGADDLVAWFTAATTFFGMPYAFVKGAHIRVELVLGHLTGQLRRAVELLALLGATLMTGTFAVAAVQMAWDSYEYSELAQGQLAVPMWIPQASMALGAAILFVAVLDATFHVCRGVAPAYDRKRTDDPIAQLRVET